jgi:cytochrome c oxidase subunit II
MSNVFIILILLLGFLITFQIAKASEYVGILKGEKKALQQQNRINGFLMMVFLVGGLIGIYWCNELFKGKILPTSASEGGQKIDAMLSITFLITGIVFFLTQILLFWFAFRYQYSEKRKAYFFPHNNNLEILWTTVPAIALVILVGFGLFYWFKITGDAPKDAMQIEVTGKQFSWIFRYPGKDGVFGKKYYQNISDKDNNSLGLIWDDPASHDDIVVNNEVYFVKNKPVKLIINSRDVIHDVGLPHFRMKMDAVPGTPTTMWLTPIYTTEEMKKMTNNPDFEYELSCDQMCGRGHFTMRAVIKVVTPDEFILWRAKQKSNYAQVFPEPAAPGDSAAKSTTLIKETMTVRSVATKN